jgi:hypothetical protein
VLSLQQSNEAVLHALAAPDQVAAWPRAPSRPADASAGKLPQWIATN